MLDSKPRVSRSEVEAYLRADSNSETTLTQSLHRVRTTFQIDLRNNLPFPLSDITTSSLDESDDEETASSRFGIG